METRPPSVASLVLCPTRSLRFEAGEGWEATDRLRDRRVIIQLARAGVERGRISTTLRFFLHAAALCLSVIMPLLQLLIKCNVRVVPGSVTSRRCFLPICENLRVGGTVLTEALVKICCYWIPNVFYGSRVRTLADFLRISFQICLRSVNGFRGGYFSDKNECPTRTVTVHYPQLMSRMLPQFLGQVT